MSDRWRYCCPEGHRHVSKRTWEQHKNGKRATKYYCNTCEQSYDGEPIDLKKTVVPASMIAEL